MSGGREHLRPLGLRIKGDPMAVWLLERRATEDTS